MSGIAPVKRFASNPRTLAITFWGEFGPPKKAPPNLENRADSPPLAPSDDATVFFLYLIGFVTNLNNITLLFRFYVSDKTKISNFFFLVQSKFSLVM